MRFLLIKMSRVESKIQKRYCAKYNYPGFGYLYGEIQSEPNIPETVYGYKVKSVISSGRWTTL